jgi:hypothetical protein
MRTRLTILCKLMLKLVSRVSASGSTQFEMDLSA